MSSFKRGAKKQDVPEGTGVVSQIEGKSVAIFNVDGEFFAISNVCPHKGGPLGEGELNGDVVTCPLHAWEFNVTTGCNPENERVKVHCFEVQVEGDDVLIKVD